MDQPLLRLLPASRLQTPLPGQTRLLHGGDYNPDQWLADHPEILGIDAELMRQAGLNSATVGVFAWAALEPKPDRFTFDWLDRTLDQQARLGNRVILATPTGAMPAWLAEAYPEARRVGRNGLREPYGARHNHCWTSSAFRDRVQRIDHALAQRYKSHPALAMWHISNELSGECYCSTCRAKWATWLEARYGTLDKLNACYWSGFWSKAVTAWHQVEPTDWTLDAMMLDWLRFNTDQVIDWYRFEAAILRPITPDVPITTNLMGTFYSLDYQRIARELDVVSDDQYPAYDPGSPGLLRSAAHTALRHALYRNFRTRCGQARTFFLMECCPGAVQWKTPQLLKRPNVHRLEMLQTLAGGADGTCYFQFRAGRGAHEKLHGAVVEHGIGLDVSRAAHNRTFQGVAGLSRLYDRLDGLPGTSVRAEVAILYDWESKWAQSFSNGTGVPQYRYDDVAVDHLLPLFRRGIPVDVISPDHDLAPYKLLIAPQLWVMTPLRALALRKFVESGGTLVATFDTAMSDESNRMYIPTPADAGIPGCGLTEVFGLWLEETDRLPADRCRTVRTVDASLGLPPSLVGTEVAALIHTTTARVEATFSADFYDGRPALVRNFFGSGHAWYHATRFDDAALTAFYRHLESRLGLIRPLPVDLPAGVTVGIRGSRDDHTAFLFLLNFSNEPVTIPVGSLSLMDVESGRSCTGAIHLGPLGSGVYRM